MKELDLSLEGILDNRWKLELIGDKKVKLSYYGIKGIPTFEKTKEAINKLLDEKNDLFIDTDLYISGTNGDIKINKENFSGEVKKYKEYAQKSQPVVGYDIYGSPFGAEEGLFYFEDSLSK